MPNYDNELLQFIVGRDKCIIINNYKNFNRNMRIKFICNCGISHEKTFRYLNLKGGAFCKECTNSLLNPSSLKAPAIGA